MKLKNKRVVITGGTSGLGRELARSFLKRGASVVVVARAESALQKMKEENPGIHTIQGDVAIKNDIHRIYFEAVGILGEVDILINNASYLGATPLRPLLDTECEDMEKVLETNLVGPFRLTKLFLSPMVLNRQGLVINISSDAAVNAYAKWGSYSISKAASDHMTRIFQEELKESGVKFLALDPGDMRTPMHFAANPSANPNDLHDPHDSAELIIKLIEDEKFNSVRGGIR